MTQRRIIFACVTLAALAATPAFSQTAPEKKPHMSPGAMAATDRAAINNRATCTREAKEMKLGYFKRRAFIKNCMRR